MDALAMTFEDNTFDLVWACESGEHMPDKQKYIDEMTRVLKPGGTIVIACWCEREESAARPLSVQDKADLKFLYDEWAHPFFISIQQFGRHMQVGGWARRAARVLHACAHAAAWHLPMQPKLLCMPAGGKGRCISSTPHTAKCARCDRYALAGGSGHACMRLPACPPTASLNPGDAD